jgi:hypothetical protein
MGFAVDEVVVGMDSLQEVQLFPVNITNICAPYSFFYPSMNEAVISTFDALLKKT